MWALVENNTVTRRQGALPNVWQNISNFFALPDVSAYGWYPFSQNIPTYDPNTEDLVSLGYTIGSEVVEDFAVVPKAPATPETRMSRLAFRSRFTTEELIGVEVARLSHADITVRATLNVLAENILAADEIDVSDARTIAGVNALVGLGLLTEERAAEILS